MRTTIFAGCWGGAYPDTNTISMNHATEYRITVHNGGRPPLVFQTPANHRSHAQIIGLRIGLRRGVVSRVEALAVPLSMKTKNRTVSAQLLLCL